MQRVQIPFLLFLCRPRYEGHMPEHKRIFTPFQIPIRKKNVLSLKNKCSHLNREFALVTHWETEAEQNTSANTPTWAPQLASAAEERSQTEVVEMLEVKTEVSWQNWPYMETVGSLPALAFQPVHKH